MIRLLGIAGSLRQGSFNLALLRAAAELAPPECAIEVATIEGIPLYDGDVEADGIPPAVQSLKEKVAAAHGLILVTPEYNNSIPGPFKNAIDWLTRPTSDIPRLFHDRPVAVCGASPGPGGTRFAQLAWVAVFRVLGMQPWFGRTLALGEAGKLFDAAGNLRDEKSRDQVAKFVVGFARFVARARA